MWLRQHILRAKDGARMRNEYNPVKSDEWYTPLHIVLKCYELLKVKYKSTILCPFDGAESQFVQWGQKSNNTVLYGMRDYLQKSYQHDYMITNPPFSIKDQIIEKVLKEGKPTALVLPLDSLGGIKRHKIWSQFGYPSVYIPAKRMQFIDGTGAGRNKISFHSIIMLLNIGKSEIIWDTNVDNSSL
jgi:hypothetical protein